MNILKYFSFLISLCLFLFSCKESSTEPETQFVQIYYKYSFKNELNTFENTLKKDLVLDGVIEVDFWLTEDEQNKILEKADLLDYFSMPDTFVYNPPDSLMYCISPDPGEQILRIKYESNDKTTIWSYPILENDAQFNNLLELQRYIVDIIESKPEYKELPAAKGGYL